MIGSSDSNRSERQGRGREADRPKEVRSKRHDRRDTNRQRGRVRAISVLGNAKSKRHRKTHTVESDGTSLKFMRLTRGGLLGERWGEVSSDRSSEDSRRKTEGAKGQRTVERASEFRPWKPSAQDTRNWGASQLRRLLLGRKPCSPLDRGRASGRGMSSLEPSERRRKEYAQ